MIRHRAPATNAILAQLPARAVGAPDFHADPLALETARTNRVLAASGACVAAAAAWTLWPMLSPAPAENLTQPAPSAPATAVSPAPPWSDPAAPQQGATDATLVLDTTPFERDLWPAPPAVEIIPPPPPPPPPPKLRVHLIAILRRPATNPAEPPTYWAALYDPESDTTALLGQGAVIAGRTVQRIDATTVLLARGTLASTLSLWLDQPLATDGSTPR